MKQLKDCIPRNLSVKTSKDGGGVNWIKVDLPNPLGVQFFFWKKRSLIKVYAPNPCVYQELKLKREMLFDYLKKALNEKEFKLKVVCEKGNI